MLFGCKIGKSLNEINGQFKYPGFEYDLYFTPDPPHMLKLARNALAELECFIDGKVDLLNGSISYIFTMNSLKKA